MHIVVILDLGKLEMLGDGTKFDQALKLMVVAYNSSVLHKSGRRSIRA